MRKILQTEDFLLGTFASNCSGGMTVTKLPERWAATWDNNEQLAYEFALRHPGEACFPWQPLASLLAEGRLYHFEYGMFDRFLAGYDPTSEHVRADVPPRLRWLVGRTPLWTFSHFFPEYTEQTELKELPGWIVRSRPSP